MSLIKIERKIQGTKRKSIPLPQEIKGRDNETSFKEIIFFYGKQNRFSYSTQLLYRDTHHFTKHLFIYFGSAFGFPEIIEPPSKLNMNYIICRINN